MVRTSSSSSSKAITSFGETIKKSWMAVFGEYDLLFYVCVAVILLYITMAKPENTPAFYSNAWVKLVLFLIVFVVMVHDPLLGTLFGFAMVLSVGYSNVNSMNMDTFASPPSSPESPMTTAPNCDCSSMDPSQPCQCNNDMSTPAAPSLSPPSQEMMGMEGYTHPDSPMNMAATI